MNDSLSRYKTRDEFIHDVRQVFLNCKTFNEDESPVGICGHNLRIMVEKRLSEIFS